MKQLGKHTPVCMQWLHKNGCMVRRTHACTQHLVCFFHLINSFDVSFTFLFQRPIESFFFLESFHRNIIFAFAHSYLGWQVKLNKNLATTNCGVTFGLKMHKLRQRRSKVITMHGFDSKCNEWLLHSSTGPHHAPPPMHLCMTRWGGGTWWGCLHFWTKVVWMSINFPWWHDVKMNDFVFPILGEIIFCN